LKALQLPIPIRAWNFCGRALEKFNFKNNISEEALINAAIKAEGLGDFGDDSFRVPLRKLLESIENEARLHSFGRFVTKQRLVGLLRNRLRAEYYFKKHPEILEIELEPPIVIAGLQRTGTTFLQRLIASNHKIRSLKSWEALNPAPHINWSKGQKDKRIAEGKKAENGLRYLNPAFFAIHPVEHKAPEEEVLLLDISFLSTVAEATLHVPSFAGWLENQDQTPAYDYMKKLMQLLTWQNPGKRWVLKTPHHLEHLDVLRKVFPGCSIIQTHRDRAITVPSLCSMIWHGRFIFSNQVDPHQIGEQWLRKIEIMLRKSQEYRKSVNGKGFIDIDYEDLIKGPTEQVKKIYSQSGMQFTDDVERHLKETLNKQKKDKYGIHKYKLEDFGLSETIIRNRLADLILT